MARNINKAIMAIKIGMTQIFDETGTSIPVTILQSDTCTVVQRKRKETDSYNAIQLGMHPRKEKQVNRPMKGHFKKANVKPLKYIKEVRVENVEDYEVGQEIKVDVFAPGDWVDVVGTSKGRGFAGGIKRHNFSRGNMTHGSKHHRRTGSLAAKGPARVFKGRKMPGRLGGDRVTVQGLRIASIYPDQNIILVKGAVPGPKRGLVIIKDSVKA